MDRAAAGIRGDFSITPLFRDRLEASRQKGRGVIILAAHTGCWQMAPYVLDCPNDMPVAVLAHKNREDIDKEAHEHASPPLFARINGEGVGTPVALLALLRQGGVLCMMGDRVMSATEPAVAVSFYGSRVMVPAAAYRLASASGAPLVFAFAVRTGPGRGELHLGESFTVPPGVGTRSQGYTPYAQRYADALENFTRENPYQFFNFYNLWE